MNYGKNTPRILSVLDCGFKKTLNQLLLCPASPFGHGSIKPRWHTIHTWNSNSTSVWNDGIFWRPKFNFNLCNLWNKSKHGMPSFSVEWSVMKKSLFRNAWHNICSTFFAIPFVHFDGVWWMALEKIKKVTYT